MILPPFLAGDAWVWNVAVRYESPTEGLLLNDRERWTVRVGKASEITAERRFLGSWVDADTFVPGTAEPETLKGKIERDGTLSVEGVWNDPAAAKILRRLLNPDKTLRERVAGWPIVRHAIVREPSTVPGNIIPATLSVEATLEKATLGGREVELPKPVRNGA